VFSRKGVERDDRTRMIEDMEIARLMKDQRDELDIIRKSAVKRLARLLDGKTSDGPSRRAGRFTSRRGMP